MVIHVVNRHGDCLGSTTYLIGQVSVVTFERLYGIPLEAVYALHVMNLRMYVFMDIQTADPIAPQVADINIRATV